MMMRRGLVFRRHVSMITPRHYAAALPRHADDDAFAAPDITLRHLMII